MSLPSRAATGGAIASGHDDESAEFVRGRSTSVLRTAFLLTGDRQHAEDLTQGVLERMYVRWRRIRKSPDAYARSALVHASINRWRSRRRRPEVPLDLEIDRPIPATRWPRWTCATCCFAR